MKKKIIIGIFSLLILITVIFFIVSAISSYNHDVQNYPDDKLVGFMSVIILILGGFVVFYELDLFYTVYYFFMKPKTLTKSILNVLANLTLLSIPLTDSIAHFLYKHVSEIFGEETIVLNALFFMYIVLRIVCIIIQTRR
ncbi:MAG: hypothetical protein J6Q89_04430 [Clostridia bacterium]|nr:hypothetical protein [Clostridia bacterium]